MLLLFSLFNIVLLTRISFIYSITYCAKFYPEETNRAVGSFKMNITNNRGEYSIYLDLSKFKDSCDIKTYGMYYHIHSYWNNHTSLSSSGSTYCGANYTGFHYDPTLACSKNSENNGLLGSNTNLCNILKRTSNFGYTYACNTSNYQAGYYSTCELGDLSGKFGKIYEHKKNSRKFSQKDLLIDNIPVYSSSYLKDILPTSHLWTSIVFHCGDVNATRILCSKFEINDNCRHINSIEL